jgi:hypothetical protein
MCHRERRTGEEGYPKGDDGAHPIRPELAQVPRDLGAQVVPHDEHLVRTTQQVKV